MEGDSRLTFSDQPCFLGGCFEAALGDVAVVQGMTCR
jgi:hypothetical protein